MLPFCSVNNGKNKGEKLEILSNKIKEIYIFLYDSFSNEIKLDIDFMKDIFFNIYMDINGKNQKSILASSKKTKLKKAKRTKNKNKRTKNKNKRTKRKNRNKI